MERPSVEPEPVVAARVRPGRAHAFGRGPKRLRRQYYTREATPQWPRPAALDAAASPSLSSSAEGRVRPLVRQPSSSHSSGLRLPGTTATPSPSHSAGWRLPDEDGSDGTTASSPSLSARTGEPDREGSLASWRSFSTSSCEYFTQKTPLPPLPHTAHWCREQ